MRETILNLIKLQEVDIEINNINKELKAEPEAMTHLRQELAAAREEQKRAQEELAEKEKNKKDAEWELKECEERVKKSKRKMMEVKTNREYQALLTEIDELNKKVSDWEEKILIALDQIESAKKVVVEKDKKVKELEERLKEAQKRLEIVFTKLKKNLVALRQKRQEIVKKIPPHLLSRYDFIRQRRNGRAVVGVIDAVCDGCHMHIPPQNYNELLKCDRLMTCPSCQRIIYWKGLLENPGEAKVARQ